MGMEFDMEAMFGIMFFLIIGIIIVSFISRARAQKYKEEVVIKVLEDMFEEYDYRMRPGYDKKRIYDTRLVQNGNRYSSDDYIRAVYKGVEFEFADVEIRNETNDGEHSSTVTYFVGQWIIVRPQKEVQGKLYVVDRQLRNSSPRGGFIFKDSSIQKVETEDVEFNDQFKVFAEYPHDAFYILTPHKMDELFRIHREDVSFFQNQDELHIAIYSNENLMEPKFFSRGTNEEEMIKVRRSLEQALSYIELFVIEKED